MLWEGILIGCIVLDCAWLTLLPMALLWHARHPQSEPLTHRKRRLLTAGGAGLCALCFLASLAVRYLARDHDSTTVDALASLLDTTALGTCLVTLHVTRRDVYGRKK
jgi:predicted nicotinamide N-methyase